MHEENLLFREKKSYLIHVHLMFKLSIDTVYCFWQNKQTKQNIRWQWMCINYYIFDKQKWRKLSYTIIETVKFVWKWQKEMENIVDYVCMYVCIYPPMSLELPFWFGTREALVKHEEYLFIQVFIQQILYTRHYSTHRWYWSSWDKQSPQSPVRMGLIF